MLDELLADFGPPRRRVATEPTNIPIHDESEMESEEEEEEQDNIEETRERVNDVNSSIDIEGKFP